MLRIFFSAEDVARTTVAATPDPLWETVLALHRLYAPARSVPAFRPWRGRVAAGLADHGNRQALGMIRGLVPPAGYFPDFLTPPAAVHGLLAGLDELRRTPRTQLRRDLVHVARTRRVPAWSRQLAHGDRTTIDNVATALTRLHDLFVGPECGSAAAHVRAAHARYQRVRETGGTEAMLASLRPLLRWERPVLTADYPGDLDVHLGGRGLRLIPSYFCLGTPVALVDPGLPPVVVFPVEHRLDWTPPAHRERHGDTLATLLGPTRARILAALTATRTTTEVAGLVGVAASSASEHIRVLRDSGLVLSQQLGREALHTLSPLGLALHAREL